MMQFTRIPQQYAPLGGELRYAVEQTAAGNIDIRIAAADGTLLGAKRFAAVTTAAAAPARTFLPGAEAAEAPALLTRMPLNRLIPEGTCDELTLLADSSVTVTVTAQAGDTTTAESYRTEEAGLHQFRLDTPDFPGAETVTVDAGACGTVTYTVIPALEGALRLAWRSSAGSVEHYTFPVVRTSTIRVDKQRAEGPEGRVAAVVGTDRETLLVSAYESRPILEALAEVAAAPEVWLADGNAYTPADVTTDEAVVSRHGSLSCLEITIRPIRKTRTSWN